MKKFFCFSLLFGVFSLAQAASPINENINLPAIVTKVMPSIVSISVRGQTAALSDIDDGKDSGNDKTPSIVPKIFSGFGSGVIIDAKKGLVVTNAHLLKDAKVVIVSLADGRRLGARLLGKDEMVDIALLQINAENLTAAHFGDSSKVKIGESVAAIGNPFDLNQTLTSGVVSALNRTGLGIEGYENFIQIDASINPGNSGGALLDKNGDVIGINTAIITPNNKSSGSIGIGLAIPSNMCQKVIQQIVEFGDVKHSIAGVMVQDLSPILAKHLNLHSSRGALITNVQKGTPADKVGLKAGEIITEINDYPVEKSSQVRINIGLMRPNSKITFRVFDPTLQKTRQVNLTTIDLDDFVANAQLPQPEFFSGVSLINFDQLRNNEEIIGVGVSDIDEFSAAFSSGLQMGDVIQEANHEKITNIADLQRVIKETSKETSILLRVKRSLVGDLFIVLER